MVDPFLLRRTKESVGVLPSTDGKVATDEAQEGELKPDELPAKTDVVVWLKLAPAQQDLYTQTLDDGDGRACRSVRVRVVGGRECPIRRQRQHSRLPEPLPSKAQALRV